jgi:hypothetical protein
MWLMILTSCLTMEHECIISKTTKDSKQECVTAAETAQARFDRLGVTRFVIICREVH